MKKIFKFPHLSLKDVCAAAMLLAITVILAIFATFRVGNQIKIPMKFISVFVTATLFGPWTGGFCGFLGDLLNAFLVPVGGYLPALSALEFLSGFTFGVFFYNQKNSGAFFVFRVILCAMVAFFIDMFLTTAVLIHAGYFPDFRTAFVIRIGAGILKAAIQIVVTAILGTYIDTFKKLRRKSDGQ